MGERRKRGEILPVNRRFDRRNPVRQFGDERLDRFDEVAVRQFASGIADHVWTIEELIGLLD